MNNENNVQPGIGDTAAQRDNNREKGGNKKSRARRNISAEAAHVLKFLCSCGMYQSDAVRVIVGHATEKDKPGEVTQTDRLAVNRFLNHGLNKGNASSPEAVMKFRLGRSEVLLKAVRPFCGQEEFFKATVALMRMTTDHDAVKTAFDNLPNG